MWLLALLIGTSFVVGALYGSFTAGRRLQGMRRVFGVLGGILLATGGVAFFSTMLASLGVIPASFEWPVSRADQIIQMQDGLHAVTHTPSGRIQVYDPAWHFVRAWNVDAAGGVFKAKLTPTGLLEVWTSPDRSGFYLHPMGGWLKQGAIALQAILISWRMAPRDTSQPLSPLWIFAHPFVAWLVGVIGMAMLATSDSKRFKFKRTQQTRSI